MMNNRLVLLLLLLVPLVMLTACEKVGDTGKTLLRTDDAKLLAQGESVYRMHCAACHGAKLEGQPNWRERDASGRLPAPPHDASGHTWHHPDQVLFRITKYGVAKAANIPGYATNMPTYEGVLSDGEIVAVLSWIKAQWPEPIRRQQEEVNAAHQRNN